MGKSRRKFSREFKLEAVKQVVEHGRSIGSVADGLDINRNLLTRWKSQLQSEGEIAFPGNGRQNEADAEIQRLKRDSEAGVGPRTWFSVGNRSAHGVCNRR